MCPHQPLFEGCHELGHTHAKVLDPNRRIDENHSLPARRLGIGLSLGSLPPSRANRLALSRSIRARSPSCISSVRPRSPVISWASANNVSSRLIVVRTGVLSQKG